MKTYRLAIVYLSHLIYNNDYHVCYDFEETDRFKEKLIIEMTRMSLVLYQNKFEGCKLCNFFMNSWWVLCFLNKQSGIIQTNTSNSLDIFQPLNTFVPGPRKKFN